MTTGTEKADPKQMNAMKKTFLMTVVSLPVLCAGTGAFAAMNPHGVAVLQALDKVTARVTEMEVPVGQAVEFGSLSIEVQACYKASPEDKPEAAAFTIIRDTKLEPEEQRQFSGWMYASSPGLSTMEHPVYAVWTLDCKDTLSQQDEAGINLLETPAEQ